MTTLVVWKEVGLSSVKEAEARYQRILSDEAPVPLSELDEPMREFVLGVRRKVSEVEIVDFGDGHGEASARYSRHGIVIDVPDGLSSKPIPRVDAVATEPIRLTVFIRELELVMGREEYPEIAVEEVD